ncbi:hypothetical protein J5N97_009764 [Dioscorea zingiberensis]|uniref:Uncharacterized protein n=1 Tax=Dioscorea zingiberensis TaxID=325984 RepID=A0A9D5CYU0_9LILI|nr:hypothetical protein J5N97_009764 [Dioscorea zingiberensis]
MEAMHVLVILKYLHIKMLLCIDNQLAYLLLINETIPINIRVLHPLFCLPPCKPLMQTLQRMSQLFLAYLPIVVHVELLQPRLELADAHLMLWKNHTTHERHG